MSSAGTQYTFEACACKWKDPIHEIKERADLFALVYTDDVLYFSDICCFAYPVY